MLVCQTAGCNKTLCLKEKDYIRIPVLLGDSVQATKHDRKDLVNVLLYETEDVLVIPEVQRSLGYLRGRGWTRVKNTAYTECTALGKLLSTKTD